MNGPNGPAVAEAMAGRHCHNPRPHPDNRDSADTVATARKYEYIWDVRYLDAPV